MPEKKTVRRAKRDPKEGKSATTAAGEFVREEIEHVRQRKPASRKALSRQAKRAVTRRQRAAGKASRSTSSAP